MVIVMCFQPYADLSVCVGRLSKSLVRSLSVGRHGSVQLEYGFGYCVFAFLLMYNVSDRRFDPGVLLTVLISDVKTSCEMHCGMVMTKISNKQKYS